jgi:3' terminal RNA ribose 2'-O-methyltransferase Hen1
MLVSIQANTPHLSFLLHKHPDRVHTQDSNFGKVHIFYTRPEQAVLLMEIDPLKLTRRGGSSGFALQPYVNDRPYVASSFLSVALNQTLRTAMAGRCESHPELVGQPLELRLRLPALPCRGGESLLRRLFEPLGYSLQAECLPLDSRFPEWGLSSYFDVILEGRMELYRALRHLYILMPVLDNEKHYWVGADEVQKLLERGQDWLADHPERDLIVSRYLRFRKDLSTRALSELAPLVEEEEQEESSLEDQVERSLGLHDQRLDAVAALLQSEGCQRIADLGCGEGKLVRRLVNGKGWTRILACDVSPLALERANANLNRLHDKTREKVELFQSSLLYTDSRLCDLDAAVLVEVIEHIEPDRLDRVAHNLFSKMRPKMVIVTTPNREYNAVWESLPAGRFRHNDHRFEWTRAEFSAWVDKVRGDYQAEIVPLGEIHKTWGSPSQMAVFRR